MAISLGRTPTEFRDTANYQDYVDLKAYIKKRGTLDLGFRAEQHTAGLRATILMAAGAKSVKPDDFMLHADKADSEPTLDNMMRIFGVQSGK